MQTKDVPQNVVTVATEEIIGLRISHTSFGKGVIREVADNGYIVVDFQHFGRKTLSYQFCMENSLLSFEF